MLYYIGVLKSVPGESVETIKHNIFPGMHINHIFGMPIIINILEKNACGILLKQYGMRGMRTRAKRKYAAGDRARRGNVPRHILYFDIGRSQDNG